MVQVRQGIHPINPKTQEKSIKSIIIPNNKTPSNEMHIEVKHTSKLYNDDKVRFLVR